MKFTKMLFVILISLLFLIGCSEINNDITPSIDFTHHPEGFGEEASPKPSG